MLDEVFSRSARFGSRSRQLLILLKLRPVFSSPGLLYEQNVLDEWIIPERYIQEVVAALFRMLNLCS